MRALLAVLASGCAGHAASSLDASSDALDVDARRCTYGDPSAPLQIELVHFDAAGLPVITPPDASLPLIVPPQGIGEVVLLGVRVTNVDGCHVELITSFHDVCDSAPLKVDSRPADLEDAGGGWAITPWRSASVLQVCTSPTAQRVTQGQPFVFTADVTDAGNRRATASITAMPTCPPGDDFCVCQCHPDFDFTACPPGPDPTPPAC